MGGMITVFDPQGNQGEIPEAQLSAFVKAGGMPAVSMKSPSGDVGYVPANRYQEAAKAGATVLPFAEQEIKHPGFWHTIAEYADAGLHAMAPVPAAIGDLASGASLKDVGSQLLHRVAPGLSTGEQLSHFPEQDAARKQAGYGIPYRAAAPIAQAAGANVPGMETSAAEGDTGAVAAHFVGAEAPYLTSLAAPAVAPFAERLAENVSIPADSFAARAAKTLGKTAIDVATDVPGIRKLKKLGRNWEATAPKPVYPGANLPEHPGVFPGASEPTATPEQLNPALVSPARTLPGQVSPEVINENRPIPGVTSRPSIERVMPPRKGLMLPGDVETPATPAPEPTPEPTAPAPKVTRAKVETLLNDALGAQPLRPGVPLRAQPAAQAVAAGKLPEGFTPVDSTALKGYKYDPSAKEFESITQGGQHYVHGDVSPEDAQAFVDADSKGRAWQQIRQNPLVAKVVNGKRVPIIKRSIVVDPETGKPEFSDAIAAKKTTAAPAVTAPAMDDLSKLLEDSLAFVKKKRAGQ